jgi:tetratricopeptide (TPR) repeat protein
MKPSLSVSTTCHLLPEMVDDALGQVALEERDLRAVVAEALRAAEMANGQDPAPGTATAREPGWPVEPGSLAEAVCWYRRASGRGGTIQPAEIAASLSNLGFAWRDQRRWAEADAAFQESLRLRRQYGDRGGEGQTWFDLGYLYQAQGRWPDAETAFGQSLAIARAVGDLRSEGAALDGLASTYAALGQQEKAVVFFEQAVAVARALGSEAFAKRVEEHWARISPGS